MYHTLLVLGCQEGVLTRVSSRLGQCLQLTSGYHGCWQRARVTNILSLERRRFSGWKAESLLEAIQIRESRKGWKRMPLNYRTRKRNRKWKNPGDQDPKCKSRTQTTGQKQITRGNGRKGTTSKTKRTNDPEEESLEERLNVGKSKL